MIEYFPGMHKALGLISSVTRKYTKEKGGKEGGRWECWTLVGIFSSDLSVGPS